MSQGTKDRKRWCTLAAAAGLLFVATAATYGDRPTTATTTTTPRPARAATDRVDVDTVDDPAGRARAGQDVYTVGQTAHTGDLNVLLRKVADPWTPRNRLQAPQAGYRYVAVELELKNTGRSTEIMSTWRKLKILDARGHPWDVTLAGYDLPQIDGSVAPGRERRGWAVFLLPANATGLHLRVKGEMTEPGALFALP